MYTVAQKSPTRINVYIAGTGNIHRTITTPGNIVSPPVAAGDIVAVTVDTGGLSRKNYVYDLKSGALKTSYAI